MTSARAEPEPRVSVCMPASRATSWFLEALDSVLSQTVTSIEVIITDDGGGDLQPLVQQRSDSRIRYFRNDESLGFSRNHSAAIEKARGDFIAFLHDDDIWTRDYLAAALDVLTRDPAIGLTLTDTEAVDGLGRSLGRRSAGLAAGVQEDPLLSVLRRNFVGCIPSASVFRRAALDGNSRPWPSVPAGDLTMYIDCILAGWRVFHIAEPLVGYRVHTSQISQDDVAMRSAVITVLNLYRFDDPVQEDQRLRRVASEFVSRAAAHLRAGRTQDARQDLCTARRVRRWERWAWSRTILLFSLAAPARFDDVERFLRWARRRLSASRRTRAEMPADLGRV